MDVNNRHAALQPLFSVIEDVKSMQHCNHAIFSGLDIFKERVSNYVITRGVELLLNTFPDVGKEYDSGLSSGRYNISSLPKECGGANPKRNWLFQHILMETFTEEGYLKDIDADIVFFTRQILYMYKKVRLQCPSKATRAAVEDFISIETQLREPSGSWSNDHWEPNRFSFSGETSIEGVHPRANRLWRLVDQVFYRSIPMAEFNPFHIQVRHGPGAVSDLKTGKDKYLFPAWPSKLDGMFPKWYFATHREPFEVIGCKEIDTLKDGYRNDIPEFEPPAKLIAVPKTFKGPRLIASEPTAHQFCQQGLMTWIRENLPGPLRRSIDFTNQEPSRTAAMQASEKGDRSTVDLSSASDRLTCWVVERAFGGNQTLLAAFHAVRTRHLIDGTGNFPDLRISLRKFAAQGSAITFPVQSIVYAGLSIAALLFVHNKPVSKRTYAWAAGKVQVFGDDIIIPNEAVPVLAALLKELQLKVNGHKTHTSGWFRESCGMDAFKGYNVTPCYLASWQLGTGPRRKPSEIISWCEVTSNSHKMGLWNLSSWMEDQLPQKLRRKIIISNETGSGCRLFTFQHGFMVEGHRRWNEDLHLFEVKAFAVASSVQKKSRGSWQDLYQWLIEAPAPHNQWSSGYLTKKAEHLVQTWVPDYGFVPKPVR